MSEVAAATSTTVLDNRRVPCALGLLRIRDVMAELADGDLLEVVSLDRFAPVEIPLWAERAGHDVLEVSSSGRWPRRGHRFRLRKRVAAKPDVRGV